MKTSYLKVWIDWLEKYRKLNDTEFGRLVRAALQYKNSGEVTKLPSREEILLDGIILDLDRDTQTEFALSVARAEAGKKGMKERWKNNEDNKCYQDITSDNKDNQNKKKTKEEEEKGQGICGVNPTPTKRFTPPNVEDVRAYCLERGNKVDAERFVAHYEANGWMRGKTKIKDWRACVRTWEQLDKPIRKAEITKARSYEELANDIFGIDASGGDSVEWHRNGAAYLDA